MWNGIRLSTISDFMHFIVHFTHDNQYIVTSDDYLTLPDEMWNWNIDDWREFVERQGTIPSVPCLYDHDVFNSTVVYIADTAAECEEPLKKIRRIVAEKRSSLGSILKLIPRVKTNHGRTTVPPLRVGLAP